jgi:hypothetical protein
MKDRFDLETDINSLWAIYENLHILAENVLEDNLTEDETVNILLGTKALLGLNINKLHDTMSQIFNLDEYNTSNY